jgi:hypothetical protein
MLNTLELAQQRYAHVTIALVDSQIGSMTFCVAQTCRKALVSFRYSGLPQHSYSKFRSATTTVEI